MDAATATAFRRLERKMDLLIRERRASTDPSRKWLSEAEAAKMVGIQERTLRRRTKSGHIPVRYLSTQGRRYRYHIDDLNKYLGYE